MTDLKQKDLLTKQFLTGVRLKGDFFQDLVNSF